MKRALSLVLTLVLLLTFLPVGQVHAAEREDIVVDGMTGFADGSFYYGVTGYGVRETDPWYFWDASQGTALYGDMER